MGTKFKTWHPRSVDFPTSLQEVERMILETRQFTPLSSLSYGDYGLEKVVLAVVQAIKEGKRIALYADYDVDGTMSLVSWIWFLKAIGYSNFIPYIPCRMKEGYGLNLEAIKHLIEQEKAQLIITMDTGITANAEAAYCRSMNVDFICTDHHLIQPSKMPDCLILNPKQHEDPLYKELCGCGITYVLLRRLREHFSTSSSLWGDLLALAGIATICDIVPLNPVNHLLAKKGVEALLKSSRSIFVKLRQSCSLTEKVDETDIGFKIGPRINAVGRLDHASVVISAFIEENPDSLIQIMNRCNEERKNLQSKIVKEAREEALKQKDASILFLGGDWHPGVVGIAASKLVEEFWKPCWLFSKTSLQCKGSARSIQGFNVTQAMASAEKFFVKFGGHQAAAGFTFEPEMEEKVREALINYSDDAKRAFPNLWESRASYDMTLPASLLSLGLADLVGHLRPFGMAFEEPRFCIEAEILGGDIYNDKETGEPKHTALRIRGENNRSVKVMFFGHALPSLIQRKSAKILVTATKNTFRGETSLQLMGVDFE